MKRWLINVILKESPYIPYKAILCGKNERDAELEIVKILYLTKNKIKDISIVGEFSDGDENYLMNSEPNSSINAEAIIKYYQYLTGRFVPSEAEYCSLLKYFESSEEYEICHYLTLSYHKK